MLRSIDGTFAAGEFVCIAGPNGAGKSTLLSVMAGLINHYSGECKFAGTEVRRWTRKEFASKVAVVTQSAPVEFAFTVEQVVLMGRTPFADGMFESDEDARLVERSMEMTGTTQFRHRDFRTLSGGEKQRVILASALAQSPQVLLLDEPTTFLDVEHQISLYRLLSGLCADGVLVIAVTHDLNLAAMYASRIVMLRAGEIAADGAPKDVLTRSTLRDVFRVGTHIVMSSHGRPWIQYDA